MEYQVQTALISGFSLHMYATPGENKYPLGNKPEWEDTQPHSHRPIQRQNVDKYFEGIPNAGIRKSDKSSLILYTCQAV